MPLASLRPVITYELSAQTPHGTFRSKRTGHLDPIPGNFRIAGDTSMVMISVMHGKHLIDFVRMHAALNGIVRRPQKDLVVETGEDE